MLEWYGSTSQVPWLFLLASWIAALALAAFAYAAWNRGGLSLHLEVRGSRPAAGSPVEDLPETVLAGAPEPGPIFEGDGIDLDVGVDNSGAARGPAWVRGSVAGVEISHGAGLVPRAGWRRAHALAGTARGPVDASSWVVGSGDPLGLIRGVRLCPDSEVALVLPRFTSLAHRRPARELEASVGAPRAGSGGELFGVREYRPGDSLRRIHWRSSARHGELVVREFEPPGLQTVAVFCDPSPPSRAAADQVARLAASEAWDCIRQGGRAFLWAPGAEPTGHLDARNLWALLEWLARYPRAAPQDEDPPPCAEVIVIAAAREPKALTEAAELAVARGARVRAWAVGDAQPALDCAVERVGTTWPL